MKMKHDLMAFLRAKIGEYHAQGLSQVEQILSDELGAFQLELLDSADHHIHGRTLYAKALQEKARKVQIIFELDELGEVVQTPTDYDPGERRVQGRVSESVASAAVLFNEDVLIREFHRRERENGQLWAGFVVNDLLPRLGGYDATESKRILRQLEVRGIVYTTRVPNAKNPDRQTTFVHLDPKHPSVRRALGESVEQSEVPTRKPGRLTSFRPMHISGGPVSDDIVRDRR